MPFGNPIIDGGGGLLRTDIQSPNYVPGVAGWRIARDGSAEFLSAAIVGSVSALGGLIVLDSTGIWTKAADGSYVRLYTDGTGAYALFNPADTLGHVITPASARGGYYAALQPQLLLTSPRIDGGPSSSLSLNATSTGAAARITSGDIVLAGTSDNITIGPGAGITLFTTPPDRTIHLSGMCHYNWPRKPASTTRVNSAVLTADPDLKFWAVAGAVYECKLRVSYSAAAAAGFQCDFTVPAGTVFQNSHFHVTVGGVATYAMTNALGAVAGMTGTGAFQPLTIEFVCVTGGTSGYVTWRWAQNVANASNFTVDANSTLRADKIA